MEEILKSLEQLKKISLSDKDLIKKLDGDTKIVLYRDLDKFDNIDELLYPHGNCVILFEAKAHYGHWVCLFKRGNTIEFFNSYSGYPDDSLLKIDKNYRKISNQMEPALSRLMLDSGYDLEYNDQVLQKLDININTCGRHVITRLLFSQYDDKEYKEILNLIKDYFKIDYDDIVTLITEYLI